MRDFVKIHKDRIEFLDSRYYLHAVTGNFYPSVTTILEAYPKNAQFFEWLKRAGEDADEIRDEAGRKGSVVHQLTEDYDNGKECSILDDYGNAQYKQIEWAMFERYVDFRTRYPQFTIDAIELNYVSVKNGFGGTLDRVFDMDGKKWLVDIKTSNAIHPHYWLQLAAYVAMYEELNPTTKIDQVGILWLNAKTRTEGAGKSTQGVGWKLQEPEYSISYYWELFKNIYTTWQHENKNTKPKNISYQLRHKNNNNGTEEINSTHSDLQEIR